MQYFMFVCRDVALRVKCVDNLSNLSNLEQPCSIPAREGINLVANRCFDVCADRNSIFIIFRLN